MMCDIIPILLYITLYKSKVSWEGLVCAQLLFLYFQVLAVKARCCMQIIPAQEIGCDRKGVL